MFVHIDHHKIENTINTKQLDPILTNTACGTSIFFDRTIARISKMIYKVSTITVIVLNISNIYPIIVTKSNLHQLSLIEYCESFNRKPFYTVQTTLNAFLLPISQANLSIHIDLQGFVVVITLTVTTI